MGNTEVLGNEGRLVDSLSGWLALEPARSDDRQRGCCWTDVGGRFSTALTVTEPLMFNIYLCRENIQAHHAHSDQKSNSQGKIFSLLLSTSSEKLLQSYTTHLSNQTHQDAIRVFNLNLRLPRFYTHLSTSSSQQSPCFSNWSLWLTFQSPSNAIWSLLTSIPRST